MKLIEESESKDLFATNPETWGAKSEASDTKKEK